MEENDVSTKVMKEMIKQYKKSDRKNALKRNLKWKEMGSLILMLNTVQHQKKHFQGPKAQKLVHTHPATPKTQTLLQHL